MQIEFSARQFDITEPLRKLVEQGLRKIESVLNGDISGSCTIGSDRRRINTKFDLTCRGHQLSAEAEAGDAPSSIADALDKLERQAQKIRSKLTQKRRRKDGTETWHEPIEVEAEQRPERMVAVGASGTQTVPVVVHDFPARVKVTETHVVRSTDAIAKKKMTLEEAVKEMEFRDKDVFVFRNAEGKINVLYRNREGRLELIEVP
jgi:putative sigma-54 modulation protein